MENATRLTASPEAFNGAQGVSWTQDNRILYAAEDIRGGSHVYRLEQQGAGTHSSSRPEIATWNRPPAPEAVLSSRPKIPSTLASGRSTPLAEGFGN